MTLNELKLIRKIVPIVFLLAISCKNNEQESVFTYETGNDWPVYGGNKAGNRYSPLDQINLGNVQDLEVAWEYDVRMDDGEDSLLARSKRAIQCQPIVVDGTLFGTMPDLRLFAVDGATGEEKWVFNPDKYDQNFFLNSNRGVVYWQKGGDKRILYTASSKLYAVNAMTGKGINDFGESGSVDLFQGVLDDREVDVSSAVLSATSPGVVYENIFIVGSSVKEGGNGLPGTIRAFDVITGELLWAFHTVPKPGEVGYDTWPENAYREVGGANSWGGLSVDETRGVVYFGTGSPTSDFYGGNREGQNLFGNCIVALDAKTGRLKWYYQTIHHDLWDRDHPCQPNLTSIAYDGKVVDILVQTTKDGLVYVLNREDGTPIFPVEEVSVPTENALPGESPWPTQKQPTKPAPLSNQVFTEDLVTDLSPESHAYVKEFFDKYETHNKFLPPSESGTLLYGYSGGAEWGGNAIDQEGIFYQNANNDVWVLEMINYEEQQKMMTSVSLGKGLYLANCAVCHGEDRKGSGDIFPSLIDVGSRLSRKEIGSLLWHGGARMPAFKKLDDIQRGAIISFILDLPPTNDHLKEKKPTVSEADSIDKKKKFGFQPKFVVRKWKPLLDQDGYPASKRPWGTLNAIDLSTGEYLWRVPLGEYPELAKKGINATGTDSYGGPIVTSGGLIFIAGTKDEKIRAFDKKSGKVVWAYQLSAGGFATPVSYMVDGTQYIAIAAGGGRNQKLGENYMAFALKK
ncbi:MAG: PQQ-binding-like beta-propeller repeat protein [Cyclobacteriaceae bacterium]